jgi:hypothetical protein
MRKGSKLIIPRSSGYPDIKTKVISYTDDEVVVRWGKINIIRVKRKYL